MPEFASRNKICMALVRETDKGIYLFELWELICVQVRYSLNLDLSVNLPYKQPLGPF